MLQKFKNPDDSISLKNGIFPMTFMNAFIYAFICTEPSCQIEAEV